MFDSQQVEPALKRNKAEYRALFFRKLWVGALWLVAVVPMVILVPQERAGVAVAIWMGTFIVVLAYLEARRVAIFRRDLKNRGGS